MASNTASIQQLLIAEKKAAEKAKRMKQAKEEAQAEIESYRAQREAEFKNYEAMHLGSKEDAQKKFAQQTQETITHINDHIAQHKSKVVSNLINLLLDIKPTLPKNYISTS